MKLTSKERVLTSLKWQEPDRTPIQLYTTPEIQQRLDDYFQGRDILGVLGVDFETRAQNGMVRPEKPKVILAMTFGA